MRKIAEDIFEELRPLLIEHFGGAEKQLRLQLIDPFREGLVQARLRLKKANQASFSSRQLEDIVRPLLGLEPAEGLGVFGFLDSIERVQKSCLSEFSDQITVTQSEDRFLFSGIDTWWVAWKKLVKRFGYVSHKGFWHLLFSKKGANFPGWTKSLHVEPVLALHAQTFAKRVLRDFSGDLNWIADQRMALSAKMLPELNRKREAKHIAAAIEGQLSQLITATELRKESIRNTHSAAFSYFLSAFSLGLELADTVERPKWFYESERTQDMGRSNRRRASEMNEKWTADFKYQAVFGTLGLDLLRVGRDMRGEIKELLQRQSDYLNEQLIAPLSDFETAVDKLLSSGREWAEDSISRVHSDLLSLLQEKIRFQVESELENQVVKKRVEHAVEELEEVFSTLPEKVSYAQERRVEQGFPLHEVLELKPREQVKRIFGSEYDKVNRQLAQDFDELAKVLGHSVSEYPEILNVSVDASRESVSTDENTRRVFVESMKRLKDRVSADLKRIEQIEGQVSELVNQAGVETMRYIVNTYLKGKVNTLMWRDRELQVRDKTRDFTIFFEAQGARLIEALLFGSRYVWRILKLLFRKVLDFLGFAEKEKDADLIKADVSQFLTEARQRNESLPFIYKRLFKLTLSADGSFYFRPATAFERFQRSFLAWTNGTQANFALIGEPGSGRSTFVGEAVKSMDEDVAVFRMDLSERLLDEKDFLHALCDTLQIEAMDETEELIEHIRGWSDKGVILVENVHALFLRSMNGFSNINLFLNIISATGSKLYWMITINRFAWDFLCKVNRMGEFFSYKARSDDLSNEQIQQLIERRHRLSGYNLEFIPNGEIKNSRSYKRVLDKPEEAQAYIKAQFFEELCDLAEGNPSLAILYWLTSIQEFDASTVKVGMLDSRLSLLANSLPEDILFTYAAIVTHGSLSIDEHAEVFNIDRVESGLLLSRMQATGLIEVQNRRYSVNILLFRPMVRALLSKNILH